MANFQSKYTGEQVEQYLDQIASGEIGGGDNGNALDSEMSDSSENAVQNKVIKVYVDTIVGNIGVILDNINGEVI